MRAKQEELNAMLAQQAASGAPLLAGDRHVVDPGLDQAVLSSVRA
jgi:hypothetical protein